MQSLSLWPEDGERTQTGTGQRTALRPQTLGGPPSSLYLCVHAEDFAVQSLIHPHLPTEGRYGAPSTLRMEDGSLPTEALVVLDGVPPLERVFATNVAARRLGVREGMSRVQAESFRATVLRRDRQQEEIAFGVLSAFAQRFSPRVEAVARPEEACCGATLVLDVAGCERLFGPSHQLAARVAEAVREAGFEASVVVASNANTALLAARGFKGETVIEPGCEAERLAPLPLAVLQLDGYAANAFDDEAEIFAAWGIHTLGELAALPGKALAARLGERGVQLQQQARGECRHLLAPEEEAADAALSTTMELEHPVELLEPLLFLLNQMLEEVLQRAAARALAIASVECCLVMAGEGGGSFVGTTGTQQQMLLRPQALAGTQRRSAAPAAGAGGGRREHRRVVRPALPERERHTLLKLIQLDLELHPPEAAVVELRMTAWPARPQLAQQGLFAAQAPEPGRMEILLARLRKLVGSGRVGSAELLDTHAPEGFRIAEFALGAEPREAREQARSPALRMVRPPRAVEVELKGEAPAAMYYEGERLRLRAGSGPWRTSGAWWKHPAWSREEWEVTVDENPQRCLRLAHDPGARCWYVIGIYD